GPDLRSAKDAAGGNDSTIAIRNQTANAQCVDLFQPHLITGCVVLRQVCVRWNGSSSNEHAAAVIGGNCVPPIPTYRTELTNPGGIASRVVPREEYVAAA